MIVRDPEVIDQLRDEPELLALADALLSAGPRRRRGRAATALGVVLVALGAAGAVLLWPSDRDGVLDQALAAIGNGPVTHVVVAARPLASSEAARRIDLATGREVGLVQSGESWIDVARNRVRHVVRLNGTVYEDIVFKDGKAFTLRGEVSAPRAPIDPLLLGFVRGYRSALEDGRARRIGEGVVDGRPVVWLEVPRPGLPRNADRVAVDKETGRPLLVYAVLDGRRVPNGARVKIVSIETGPRNEGVFAAPKITQPRETDVAPVRDVTLAEAETAGLTALGAAYDDFRLATVTLERFEFAYAGDAIAAPTADAYRFVYEQRDGAGIAEVVQSRDPRPLQWLGIVPPGGTADVFRNMARLVHDGLHTTVIAPDSATALAMARAIAQKR